MMSDPEGSLLRRCPGSQGHGVQATPTRDLGGGSSYANPALYPRTQLLGKQYTSTPRINVADINNGWLHNLCVL